MSRFSFGEPFTRKQCVIVLLVLLLTAWTVALVWYANARQGTWHVVEARIIETQYESAAQGNVVLYEFEARPYLAMLPNVSISKAAFYPGAALSVYVNDANPSRAVLTPKGQLNLKFIHAVVLILSSAFGLYLAFRLMKTLEIERVSEQSRGLVDRCLMSLDSQLVGVRHLLNYLVAKKKNRLHQEVELQVGLVPQLLHERARCAVSQRTLEN